VPVWGKAAAGEKVAVEFRGQKGATTASADGRWIVFLEKLAASTQGADLTVAGKNTLVVHDVVVGEVWLCSGQSNMEFTVDARPGTWQSNSRTANAAAEIAAANFPLIRHVRIEHTVAEAPADTVKTGGWEPASPRPWRLHGGGIFFCARCFSKLGVPVGVIHSSWGGTPVESWMSPAALASDPRFKIVTERWQQNVAAYAANKAAFDAALAVWTRAETAAKSEAAPKAKAAKSKQVAETPYAAWLKKNPRPRAPRGPGDP